MNASHLHHTTVRVEGESLEEALAKAADELGVATSALAYEVEQEGAHGFLGLGHKPFILSASVDVGEIEHRVTKRGEYVRVWPPMTLAQAEHELEAHHVHVDRGRLAGALAAPAETWVTVGAGAAAAPAPKVVVAVAEDEMSATLAIEDVPEGGRTFEDDELVALLRDKGVTFGLDREMLAEAADGGHHREPLVVARGAAPEHGVDAQIRYHFRTDKSQLALVEDAHGHIDFHESHLFEDAIPGQLLAEKVVAGKRGSDGRTVTGKVLPAHDGSGKVELRAGKNTTLSPDGTQLTAAIAGQVLFSAGLASVEAVLEVRGNVDFKSGNIHAKGSVVIRGDVTAGFLVHAEGNVDIHGLVECAEVRAKGDVVVHKGVLGKDTAKIDAGGDVFAKFLDRVTVHAGRDAVIGGEILTSRVKAARHVKCAGARGSIVGGHVIAGETISAATLGSRLGVETKVVAPLAVICTQAVYPGVRLRIREAKLEIQDREGATRFGAADGVVVRLPAK